MADVKWIKICTDIFDDEKILLIDSMPEHDSIIVIWFKLLCMAGKQNNGGVFLFNDKIAYTDEMLATIFRRPLNTVRLALQTFEQFGMIEIINNIYTIPNWNKHQSLEKFETAKEKTRKRVAKHREKQKQITNGNVTVTDCNTECNVTVTDCNAYRIDKDKEIDIEEEKERDKEKDASSSSIYPSIIDTHTSGEEILIDTIDAKVKRNIDYDILRTEYIGGELENIVALIVDAIYSTAPTIRIGGNDIPTDSVRSRFYKLDCEHIRYVLDSMSKNSTKVRNIKAYLLTSLYNAPATISSYYTAEVNHDMKGGATGG